MNRFLLTAVLCSIVAGQARAADPELSIDARRMLGFGTLAVMIGACKPVVTAEQTAQINKGLEAAADKQKDFTEDEFTEMMKAAGAQIGTNRAAVCGALTPDYIDTSIKQAAAGE